MDRAATGRPEKRPTGRSGGPASTGRPSAAARLNAGHHARFNAGHHHRPTAYRPLCANQVRQQRFSSARRGLDPAEVDGFLRRIADELTALHAELGRTREENVRIKGALRDWQSRFGPRVVRR
ncbi:DivIVA domain-containing protein [Micromonospora sp. PLK6-60]|uniref:DivIVA domain-containing protein n=1 Tax=Micromonospora sp. PLK6-60 TaxID=2873383 RepID=UPI001CA727AA|nr:DivIVA domain-containing protein [Micromonospora sp. PLK6-60]